MLKLSQEKKKMFKNGVMFGTFDDSDSSFFAVARVSKIDLGKVQDRMLKMNYLFAPLKPKFESLVRITALVLRYKNKLRKRAVNNLIERGKKIKKDLETLNLHSVL